MDSNKYKGRVVGLLLLMVIIAGSTSLNFRGLSSSLISQDNFLQIVFDKSFGMKISILLNFIAGGIWLFISIWLYPFLSKYSKPLALWFVCFWLISFSVSLYGDISHLSLIDLSEMFMKGDAQNITFYELMVEVKLRDYFSAHFFGLIAYAMATFSFFYLLLRERLIPKFLAAWGMCAMAVVFFTTWSQIFGYKVSFYFYAQNGVHMIAFTLWLIVKGFNSTSSSKSELT